MIQNSVTYFMNGQRRRFWGAARARAPNI